MLTWCKQNIEALEVAPVINLNKGCGTIGFLMEKAKLLIYLHMRSQQTQLLVNNPHSPPPLLSTRALVGPALESLSYPSVYLSIPVIMHTILLTATL